MKVSFKERVRELILTVDPNEGRQLLAQFAEFYPEIRDLSRGSRLNTIRLEFVPGTSVAALPNMDDDDRPCEASTRTFQTEYRVVLQEFVVRRPVKERRPIGELTVQSASGAPLAQIALTPPRFICMRRLVLKSISASEDELRSQGIAAIRPSLEEYEHDFEDFQAQYEEVNFENVMGEHIRGYICRIRQALDHHGIKDLVSGSFRVGPYLTTHPRNVAFFSGGTDGD